MCSSALSFGKQLLVVKGQQFALYHDIVKMNVESIDKQSWHVLFKVHIYENLAGGSLKAIFL